MNFLITGVYSTRIIVGSHRHGQNIVWEALSQAAHPRRAQESGRIVAAPPVSPTWQGECGQCHSSDTGPRHVQPGEGPNPRSIQMIKPPPKDGFMIMFTKPGHCTERGTSCRGAWCPLGLIACLVRSRWPWP